MNADDHFGTLKKVPFAVQIEKKDVGTRKIKMATTRVQKHILYMEHGTEKSSFHLLSVKKFGSSHFSCF